MKAISLWQPWASLIAVGAKRIETRSWPYPMSLDGQFIAIHAAQKYGPEIRAFAADVDVVDALTPHYPDAYIFTAKGPRLFAPRLPFRAVVAIAKLAGCHRVEQLPDTFNRTREFKFGNYSAGRWFWKLEDVRPLATPIPAKGFQRFFPLPSNLEQRVLDAVVVPAP